MIDISCYTKIKGLFICISLLPFEVVPLLTRHHFNLQKKLKRKRLTYDYLSITIITLACGILHNGGSTMYSYHNRIRQRIRNGELVDHYFTDGYKNIGEALVLVFSTEPYLRPIRPHRWGEYAEVIGT